MSPAQPPPLVRYGSWCLIKSWAAPRGSQTLSILPTDITDKETEMRVLATATALVLVASVAPAPQFGGLKSLVKSLTGDDKPGEVNGDYEQVPYEVLAKYKVSVGSVRAWPGIESSVAGIRGEEVPQCQLCLHTDDLRCPRRRGQRGVEPGEGHQVDDQQEIMEGQTSEQDVHEAVQIHRRGEQGEPGDRDDGPSLELDVDSGSDCYEHINNNSFCSY